MSTEVVTSDRVERMLTKHGYRVLRDTADHTLFEHHGDRIVVPLHSRELSPWSARVIEWSLEARLGRGWLTGDPLDPMRSEPAPARSAPVPVRHNLVIRAEPDGSAWNAFVVEEPRILTFGSSLAEVQERAADATSVWYAGAPEVELTAHLQLDAGTGRWVDEANDPSSSADRRTEARQQLVRLGLSEGDIRDLLAWPQQQTSWMDVR